MIGKIGYTSGAGPIPKPEKACKCVASDRWRCATRRQMKSVSCSCPCHGYIRATPEEGTQA